MTQPRPLRPLDSAMIDRLFDMGGGYVLAFSDRTFGEFFDAELDVNIDDPKYSAEGTSKARRLRYFLRVSAPEVRVAVLQALWQHRLALRQVRSDPDPIPDAEAAFTKLVLSVGEGKSTDGSRAEPLHRGPTEEQRATLAQKLLGLAQTEPHPRGYAFEALLGELFEANGLAPRAAFRLVGEQIDGSFQMDGQTYLVEAKWEAARTGANDLRAFNGKVQDKVAWARGVFISHTGFTDVGLEAFGRGHSVVCVNGRDLHELLHRRISLHDVLARKVRHAVETGQAYVAVAALFP